MLVRFWILLWKRCPFDTVFISDVLLGSEITMRHVNTQGGYLHSHEHNYPTGSQRKDVVSRIFDQ